MRRRQIQFRTPRWSNRGQAALEFLTTYGWALLIVLVMVGAISYFGILNPTEFVPQRCSISAEFSCSDYQIRGAGSTEVMNLQVKQGVGKTIYYENWTCEYSDLAAPAIFRGTATIKGAALSAGSAWSPKDTAAMNCNFRSAPVSGSMPAGTISGLAGQKVKVEYTITYRLSPPPTGLLHTAQGEVFTEVQ